MALCCINCFNDSFLQERIKEEGNPGPCDFCKKRSKYCVEPETLRDMFEHVVNLYTPIEDFMPLHDLKQWDGDYIWEKLQSDWELFKTDDYQKQERLVKAIFSGWSHDEGEPLFLTSYVEDQDEYWGVDDEASEKLKALWKKFCEEIIYKNRYFIKKRLDLKLLGEILSFQSHIIKAKSVIYRTRISINRKFPKSEMGKPPIEITPDGRANPKGIPYLYVATDIATAIEEVRPLVEDKVTVGKFIVKLPLRVIDLREPKINSPFQFGWDLEFVLRHLGFLKVLGLELSKPINPRSAGLEYIPLQFLCEFIKNEHYDGVMYKSAGGAGNNLAIFDDTKVKCISTSLYLVEKTKSKYKKIS